MSTADIPQNAGLCSMCHHAMVVTSARGSGFILCNLSKNNPAYARYPRLPVLQCEGCDPPASLLPQEKPIA